MNILSTLTIVGGLFFFISLIICIAERINKRAKAIENEAKLLVQRRLADRGASSTQEILKKSHIPNGLHAKSKFLLNQLADIIKIEPGMLKYDDLIFRIMRVNKNEFDNLDEVAWNKLGCKEYIEVFGYDLLSLLESNSDKLKWEEAWSKMDHSPSNEDEWIDYIYSLQLCQFLRFFSPLLKDSVIQKNSGDTK